MSAARYVIRRLAAAVTLLAVVATLTFALVHLAPGDPVYLFAGDGGTPEYYAEVRRVLGLDRPLPVQLAHYLARVARGDLGRSLHQGQPVAALIGHRALATVLLAGTAFVVAAVTGVALGTWAATRAYGWGDRILLVATSVGAALPVFWTALLLALVFSLHLDWLPVQGMRSARPPASAWAAAVDVASHLVLPVVALSLQPCAAFSRVMRAKMLEALAEPYVRTARAKGLAARGVLFHAARNALLPVVTVIGGYATVLVTGAVLTETVFAWPGLGRLALDATLARDYPVILGTVLVASVGTIVINLVTDLLYAVVDPRITYA
ncbi:MAG: ABC transporter permease [Firmicutes bacterium]|nr:ABC transporter permease [Bacillota bacterium]